jgi:hypothetical protein
VSWALYAKEELMRNRVYLFVLVCLLVGCQSTQLKPYDETGFNMTSNVDRKFRVTLETGKIKIGHSSWISAIEYESGVNPTYYCADQGRHDWMGEPWMYTLKDQKQAADYLIQILQANNMYDESSPHEMVIQFLSVAQGARDEPVYTFEINLQIIKSGNTLSSSNFTFVGNDMSEEYWTTDSWGGAKKRATNRLLSQVIENVNAELANGI